MVERVPIMDRCASPPEMIEPGQTMELVASPRRPGMSRTNFGGGIGGEKVWIGQFRS